MKKGFTILVMATAILFASSVSYAHPPDRGKQKESTIEKVAFVSTTVVAIQAVDIAYEAVETKTNVGLVSPTANALSVREGFDEPAFADLRSRNYPNTYKHLKSFARTTLHYSKLGYSMANR